MTTTSDAQGASHAGQAVYTPLTLALYDLVVLGLSNRYIWRTPTRRILQLYHQHATANHLDVGVGTGWYLDRCRFPVGRLRLGLLDLNQSPLDKAAKRLARYEPEAYRTDVLTPPTIRIEPFDSISATYLLHCLPGRMKDKAAAFDNLMPLLNRGGVIFGATLLAAGVRRSPAARVLMRFYNKRGIFSNAEDDVDGLRAGLDRRFGHVELETIGCAALFVCGEPWRPQV